MSYAIQALAGTLSTAIGELGDSLGLDHPVMAQLQMACDQLRESPEGRALLECPAFTALFSAIDQGSPEYDDGE